METQNAEYTDATPRAAGGKPGKAGKAAAAAATTESRKADDVAASNRRMLTYAAGLSCVEQGGHGGQHAASNQGGEREASMSSSPSTNSRAKPTTLAAAAKAARALLERLPGTRFTGLYWALLGFTGAAVQILMLYMCPHTALKRAEHEHTRAAAAGKSSGVGSRMVSSSAGA